MQSSRLCQTSASLHRLGRCPCWYPLRCVTLMHPTRIVVWMLVHAPLLFRCGALHTFTLHLAVPMPSPAAYSGRHVIHSRRRLVQLTGDRYTYRRWGRCASEDCWLNSHAVDTHCNWEYQGAVSWITCVEAGACLRSWPQWHVVGSVLRTTGTLRSACVGQPPWHASSAHH